MLKTFVRTPLVFTEKFVVAVGLDLYNDWHRFFYREIFIWNSCDIYFFHILKSLSKYTNSNLYFKHCYYEKNSLCPYILWVFYNKLHNTKISIKSIISYRYSFVSVDIMKFLLYSLWEESENKRNSLYKDVKWNVASKYSTFY